MQMRPRRVAAIAAQPDLLTCCDNLAHPHVDTREMGQVDFVLLVIDQETYRHALAIETPLPRLEYFANHGRADDRPHRRDDVVTFVRERCAFLTIRVRDARW